MMNTSISRRQFLKASGLAAAGACAAGLLTGCGGSSSGSASGAASSGSGSSYTILYDSQPATLNYLTTGTDLEMVVGANCVDTLVEYDNKGVMREGLAAFAPQSRADGALLVQAHPFRKKCTPAPAEYLDGIEVLNLNPRHDSHNDLALAYAREHHLIMTAGSDCHRPGDQGTTGILSDTLPEDSFGLADLLRSGNYTIIHPECTED